MASSPGVEVFNTPSSRQGLRSRERAEVDSGGLGHPGRAREKSFWRWERDSHVGEYVGVRAQVQEVESHLGEKL